MEDLPDKIPVTSSKFRKWLNEVKDLAARNLSGVGTHSGPGGYSIVPTNLGGGIAVLYELTADMAIDGTTEQWKGEGKPVVHSDDTWAVDTDEDAEELHLASGFQDTGVAIGLMPYRTGQRVYVVDNAGVLEIISPTLDVWRFELKTAFDPATGYADAYLVVDGTIDTGIEFPVHGKIVNFRGKAYVDSPSVVQGSRGYVKYFPDSNKWEIQSMDSHVKWFTANVNTGCCGITAGDSCFEVDCQVIWQPTDQSVWLTATGDPETTVHNTAGYEVAEDKPVLIAWDDTNEKYELVAPLSSQNGTLHLGKVQAGHTNLSPQTKQAVSVKRCDVDGNEIGDAFNVWLLANPDEAGYLFTNKIISYGIDPEGEKVINSNKAYGPLFGTIWWVDVDAAIPQGWSTSSEAAGRFPLCWESGHGTWGTLKATGGDGVDHSHNDHTASCVALAIEDHPASCVAAAICDHSVHYHCSEGGCGCGCYQVASGTDEYCWIYSTGHTTTESHTLTHSANANNPLSHSGSSANPLVHSADGHMPYWICWKAIVRTS